MRTERPANSDPVRFIGPTRSMERGLSVEVETYVASALRLERMALDLAQRNVEEGAAVHALIDAADGDVRVMRRAHRHSELALSEQWPAGPTLIRAFDYLSAGRKELEIETSQLALDVFQPSVRQVQTRHAGSQLESVEYDIIDEASMESFPASDPPSFWAREQIANHTRVR
jgi:hypothetical protein